MVEFKFTTQLGANLNNQQHALHCKKSASTEKRCVVGFLNDDDDDDGECPEYCMG